MNAYVDFDIWIAGSGFGFTLGVMELYDYKKEKDRTMFIFTIQVKLFGKELLNFDTPS